jgi:hypothetical protein
VDDRERRVAWDIYFSSLAGMNAHPGTTRDAAKPRTLDELAEQADRMLALRDNRFRSA